MIDVTQQINAVRREVGTRVLEAGDRSILYTQLANPISNAIYRRIGYEAVGEILSYRFGT